LLVQCSKVKYKPSNPKERIERDERQEGKKAREQKEKRTTHSPKDSTPQD
jgi:hypothetical protein